MHWFLTSFCIAPHKVIALPTIAIMEERQSRFVDHTIKTVQNYFYEKKNIKISIKKYKLYMKDFFLNIQLMSEKKYVFFLSLL